MARPGHMTPHRRGIPAVAVKVGGLRNAGLRWFIGGDVDAAGDLGATLTPFREALPCCDRDRTGSSARRHDQRTLPRKRSSMLNLLDEFARENLAIRSRRKPSSADVIDVLTDLFILHRVPGLGSVPTTDPSSPPVRRWTDAVGARTAFIEPGSPWEIGCIESSNARFRDEILDSLNEARIIIEAWRRHDALNAKGNSRLRFRRCRVSTGPRPASPRSGWNGG